MPAVKRQPAALTNERTAVSVTTGSSACAASIDGDASAARHAGRSCGIGGSAGAVGSAARRPISASRGIGARPVRSGDTSIALAVAASASVRMAAVGMFTGCAIGQM
eukprot:scaffold25048_cov79-Isochrysis_galbana.AAC.1